MTEKKCETCITVKENLYWTRFSTMHFCQFLTKDFHFRLVIPKKFADNKRKELHQQVEIRGPSGATWEVALLKSDENLYFGDGWEEFVNDHSLEQNDILIFNYKGNSQFDVLILDRRSLCEKENSYYVTRCKHSKNPENDGHVRLLQKKKSVMEVIENEPPLKKKPRKADIPLLTGPGNNTEVPVQGAVVALKSVKTHLGDELGSVVKKGKKPSSALICASNGRSVTDAEKRAVLRKACEELTNDCFVIVMRATHVYKKFFLTVPAEWLTTHVIQSSRDVILRTEEKSWRARLVFSSNGHGGIRTGWKAFALGNSLEEYDVCLFKLGSSSNEPLTILDVTIFRVVPKAIPLTITSAGASMS